MKFFVDANVVVYSAVPSPYRQACLEILFSIGGGLAEGSMSTAALEEVWHLELSGRAGSLQGLTQRAYRLFSPLLPVTDATFQQALSLAHRNIGANDRLHIATCAAHGIPVICSADAGFDGVPGLRRVDPLDTRARRRMLA